ncbi:MAG: glycosyltransferase [Alphaproteobacteria bacterium]|nr:glycosyltransferase [Alphaproteobacteria bacterium]
MSQSDLMPATKTTPRLRVAVLVDLPRSALSGGHVKGWESRAAAAAKSDIPIDLTVFFSGKERTDILAPHVRLRDLPPLFSTSRLSFLPYVPDNTDLAPYHPALAKELKEFDVIHTTDAYFAFSRTAERISKKYGIPLVTSFHTDTPSYANVFTRNTIEKILGKSSWLSHFLTETCRLPARQEQKMLRKLRGHLACCSDAFAVRPEDIAIVGEVMGSEHAHDLRVVSNKTLFNPNKADRKGVESAYNIPEGHLLALFVGRLDVGKNIYILIEAMEKLIAQNVPVHLLTAGLGPASDDLKTRLGSHVTVAGFVDPENLARIMASADVFAFTSEIEIRSFVSVEALAAGLPVLVSEKGGIAALIEAGDGLRAVATGAQAWADALKELAENPELVAKMRSAAQHYTQTKVISWEENMRDEFFPVWEKAARKG